MKIVNGQVVIGDKAIWSQFEKLTKDIALDYGLSITKKFKGDGEIEYTFDDNEGARNAAKDMKKLNSVLNAIAKGKTVIVSMK